MQNKLEGGVRSSSPAAEFVDRQNHLMMETGKETELEERKGDHCNIWCLRATDSVFDMQKYSASGKKY